MPAFLRILALGLAAGVAAGLALGAVGRARAHDAPSGWAYPAACCSNIDCAPIARARVTETADGFALDTGETVPRADAKRSGDEDYHLCRSQLTGRLLCLFVPHRGF